MRFPLHPSAALVLAALTSSIGLAATVRAQNDLDAFMKAVLARRDDNWQKLQQYVLDEREEVDIHTGGRQSLWGERRDYTWYLRDGLFVRSPLKVNGVTVSEADRRKYEAEFVKREQAREERRRKREKSINGSKDDALKEEAPRDLQGLIRQAYQPQFISTAYFLRFKFDEGRYALAGREQVEARDALRIEYYPTKLFSPEKRDDAEEWRRRRERGDAYAAALTRLMNKASRVTLWIEPTSHQILKYTFNDLDWDFLPGQWLVNVLGVTASMTMGEPFPDVWLPRSMEVQVGMRIATSDLDLRYAVDYHDYRRAEVSSGIGVPERR